MSSKKQDFSKPVSGFTTCEGCVNYETSLYALPCAKCVSENFYYDSVTSQWRRKLVL